MPELQPIMKKDGRTYDCKTQEAIRLMAVERILEGEDEAVVMDSYGLCRTTAYKWLAKARGHGREKRVLAARKASSSLSTTQGCPCLFGRTSQTVTFGTFITDADKWEGGWRCDRPHPIYQGT
ncbi:MAG: helix-turn-helix domain containing protein [Candidatus Thiodiazotropha sp. (ex Dulcina madagascariensis)]|nr:helix-turn-helix domain containing protein [Candidatus Thiodiazotropha sp. (ex Dulcina madagascariensis)]